MIADLDFDHIINRLHLNFYCEEKIFLSDIDNIVTHYTGNIAHDKDIKNIAKILEDLNVIRRAVGFVSSETAYELSMR